MICSETEYKNSTNGINRINELRKVASLSGYQINESDFTFDNLLTFYLANVSIPETYYVDCYERLFEFRVTNILKTNTHFIETTAKNPIAFITDSLSKVFSGIGTFFDYLIIILLVAGLFIGIYLLTDYMKVSKG